MPLVSRMMASSFWRIETSRSRSITLEMVPPPEMPLEEGIDIVRREIIQPLKGDGTLTGGYSILLTGNADKQQRVSER